EDRIDTVEGPFFKYWQQQNRRPIRRAISALPLTIAVKKRPTFDTLEKNKSVLELAGDDISAARKHLKTTIRQRPQQLRIQRLPSLRPSTTLASMRTPDQLFLPFLSSSSEPKIIAPSTSSQQAENINTKTTTTATTTTTTMAEVHFNKFDGAVKATAANCQKIKLLASIVGLNDVQSWTRKNCAFLGLYAPQATCDQIFAFVDSCYIPKV
ncbi:hypothetical protein Tcan_06889, partial [Toxocara canis]